MSMTIKGPNKLARVWRMILEVGILVFLLYAVLLMREFTQTNGEGKSLMFAMREIFTFGTLVIAIASALICSIVLENLRKQP